MQSSPKQKNPQSANKNSIQNNLLQADKTLVVGHKIKFYPEWKINIKYWHCSGIVLWVKMIKFKFFFSLLVLCKKSEKK